VSGGGGGAPAEGSNPLRWGIVTLLVLATLINYIDRQTVSVLAPVLQKELHLTNLEYATVGTWFLLAYSLSMWVFGAVFDRIGNRAGFAVAITLWSVAACAHALARGLGSLSLARFVLGMGESGNWPGATRTVAAWFGPRERALGMGIVNTGAALGSAIAPPLVVFLQTRYGWQAAFLMTGALGFLWLVLWLAIYPRPADLSALGVSSPGARTAPYPWRLLLPRRQVWAIVLARFFGDPIWWLYLIWLPLYLHNARGFSLKQIGLFAWVPFLAADLGCLAGGWLSGFLIGRGWSVNAGRKTAITIGTVLMPAGMAAAWVASPYQALACISVTLFGFQFWVGNVQTLASDFFPVSAVGSIAGFAGTAAGIGAMIFTLSTGWVVDHFSYTPILVAAGLLGPTATAVLFLVGGPVHPVATAEAVR
jgi:MFS transporter, ACS family, hexuronate transporter